jgi:hypothetical protein
LNHQHYYLDTCLSRLAESSTWAEQRQVNTLRDTVSYSKLCNTKKNAPSTHLINGGPLSQQCDAGMIGYTARKLPARTK